MNLFEKQLPYLTQAKHLEYRTSHIYKKRIGRFRVVNSNFPIKPGLDDNIDHPLLVVLKFSTVIIAKTLSVRMTELLDSSVNY